MSSKFTHYLITRFNVPVKNWERDKVGKPVLDDAWMEDRLALFTSYCVPTIAGQLCKDFQWLIYCDQQTQPRYMESIRHAIHHLPQADIRMVNDFQHLLSDLRQQMASAETPFVISSRVDNDDGLGKFYIQKTQDFFIREDKTLLNLAGGILYDLDQKILTELRDMRLNHYGSLVEKTSKEGNYLTVLGYPHHQPPENIKVHHIPSRYSWLKIIHSRNMNSRTFGVPVFKNNLQEHFPIDNHTLQISLPHTIWYLIHRSFTVLKRKVLFTFT